MEIKRDDLEGIEIANLVRGHLQNMTTHSPRESMHALDLEALRAPGISVWGVWECAELLSCGALRELDAGHGEVKSMVTSPQHLRRGAAACMLRHLIGEARRRGYRRLSLETGAIELFVPAHKLYTGFGFRVCGPFGDYVANPDSVFMSLEL